MSVFLPHEWEVDGEPDLSAYVTKTELLNYLHREPDLSVYATKTELLNYLQREADGSVDINNKRLTGLAMPTDNTDAVTKKYVHDSLSGSIICITAEAAGGLIEDTSCFSFGANGYVFTRNNGGINVDSGVVMPSSGRVRYFTVTSISSSGDPPPHGGLAFALVINGSAILDPTQVVEIPSGQSTGIKTFHRDFYTVNTGDTINFYNVYESPHSFNTVISVFIELDH